jgi:HlyD family secretion protein
VAVKKALLLLVPAVLAGAGLAWWLAAHHQSAVRGDIYDLATVECGTLSEIVSTTGTVQPREVYVVGTDLGGRVVAVLADFNQTVEEGDLLLRLDDGPARDRLAEAELAVAAARAALAQAQAQRNTAERMLLREKQRSPEVRRQADMDILEGNLQGARAAVQGAQAKLHQAEEAARQGGDAVARTAVRAPVLGCVEGESLSGPTHAGVGVLARPGAAPRARRSLLVIDRKVSLGQVIGPPASAHLFTLAANLEQVQVIAQVAEGDIGKVARGQQVRFTAAGVDESVFEGRVEEIRPSPTTDRGAVFYQAVIEARNSRDPTTHEWRLRPGQTASVEIVHRRHERACKVPAAALDFQPDDALLTDAARAKLRQGPPDAPEQWRVVWMVGADDHPWPVFVRTGGRNARGEEGIQDGPFTEAMGWDPELHPAPEPGKAATWPRLITATPGWGKGGWFNVPQFKF